jgi:hypothetical protein
MNIASSHHDRNDIVLGLWHLVVAAATVVVGGVLVIASRRPGAELETVLLAPGAVVGLAGLVFGHLALRNLRLVGTGRARSISLALSVVELAVGIALAAGVAAAVQSYGVLEPWRSPLLFPSLALLATGLWGTLRGLAHGTT